MTATAFLHEKLNFYKKLEWVYTIGRGLIFSATFKIASIIFEKQFALDFFFMHEENPGATSNTRKICSNLEDENNRAPKSRN